MKAFRFAPLVLVVAAVAGANAFAGDRDNGPEAPFTSTLTRAEVHAQAVANVAEQVRRNFNHERGEYLVPEQAQPSALTRMAVREEARTSLASRKTNELYNAY